MSARDASKLAMDGNLRTRLRVRDDQQRGEIRELLSRMRELDPSSTRHWLFTLNARTDRVLEREPSEIGLHLLHSVRDLGTRQDWSLQDSRPEGEQATDRQSSRTDSQACHPGRPRGRERATRSVQARANPGRVVRTRLPLRDSHVRGRLGRRDGASLRWIGQRSRLTHGEVRTASEIERIRQDIERLRRDGHRARDIGQYLLLDPAEVSRHLIEMSRSPSYYVGDLAWALSDPLDGSGSDRSRSVVATR